MSLATRCSACGTVFRVVQDQLRVSGGWVRCGRCGEVFNAVESLVDLEMDRPAEGAVPSLHGERVMQDLARVAAPAAAAGAAAPAPRASTFESAQGATPAASHEAPHQAPYEGVAPGAVQATAPDGPLEGPLGGPPPGPPGAPQAEAAGVPLEAPAAGDERARAAAGEPGAMAVDDALQAPAAAPPPAPPSEARAAPAAAAAPASDAAAPGFLRQAERAARWRRPRVRAGLALLALLAAAALAWQLTLVEHDLMAARWPALRPLIERVCIYGGCSVEPPRRIDRLTVESSGLVRAGPPGAYRLSLVLRNRERMALRLPHVDLALTDAEGRLLARRVLAPAQLGAPEPRIAAGAELPLAAALRVRDAAVVGYTIEIFYP